MAPDTMQKSKSWIAASSLVLSLALPALASTPLVACSKSDAASEKGATYSAKGVIKSFGPENKFANIAHEEIPGYMAAMTMSFEPASPAQFDGLAAGDKVAFTFKDEGGKRTITEIKKAP